MTIFEETSGVFSMRRVCALILVLASIALGVLTILCSCTWQVVACAIGVPLAAALLLFFFTTWQDITAIVKAWKDKA